MLKALRQMMRRLLGLSEETQPNERDMDLPFDDFVIKSKLGRSWFRRRLSPNYREQVLRTLTQDELARARAMGWVS